MKIFTSCYWIGHKREQSYFRAPIYEYWVLNKETGKHEKKDMVSDLNQSEFFCHRCDKYVSKWEYFK